MRARWALLLLSVSGEVSATALRERLEARITAIGATAEAAPTVAEPARAFYAARGFTPAWTDGRRVGPSVLSFLELLEDAASQGLEPEDYPLEGLRSLAAEAERSPARSAAWLRLDVELSLTALTYGHHLANGRTSPEEAGLRWLLERRRVDVAAALARGLASSDPALALRRLAPTHPEHALLQAALARLLEHGPRSQRVGTEAGAGLDSTALRRLLVLNLERWRWMPEQLGDTHARVNLPAYELRLIEDGTETLRSRVIVGRDDWQTPAFTDSLRQVMVNPHWNVPDPIARHELLPKLRTDPSLLVRRRYTVLDGWRSDAAVLDPRGIDWRRVSASSFPYRLRQEPGPGNVLGRLIFMLDNDFEIYIHDTPGKGLFERQRRALSHGCIRLEAARPLADRLFEREARGEELASALRTGRSELVDLGHAVPLHVLHFTVEPEGAALRVHEDLYGVDARLAAALEARRRVGFAGW